MRCSVHIVCPAVSICSNLKLHQKLVVKNTFKREEIKLHLTFNPGLTLTGFRTTRPRCMRKRLHMSKFVAYKLGHSILTPLYESLIRPLMEYGDIIWNNRYDCYSALLDSVQYEAARLVTGAVKGTRSARLYKELAWESLSSRRKLHLLSQFYKIANNLARNYLSELLCYEKLLRDMEGSCIC